MKDDIPVLLSLSKIFQTGSLNFTQITPGTEHAKSKLKEKKRDQRLFKTTSEGFAGVSWQPLSIR